MTPEPTPEDTLTFPVIAEDTETMPALPAVTETVPAQAPGPGPVTYPTFGDMLEATRLGFDDKPADAILPCGHCGAVFTVPDADPPRRWFEGGPAEGPWTEWEAARPLYQARRHAHAAGWNRDASDIWTCPGCRQAQDGHWITATRAEARAAAAAAREHRDILAHADGRFADVMAARGGGFTCRWSYEEPAAEWSAAA